jgi:hypothetical protein
MSSTTKTWDYVSNTDDKLSKQVAKDPTITFTKHSMAKYLISTINFKDGDEVMNTSYGDGAFYDNLPSNTENHFCEINEPYNQDYLKQNKIVDITLDNPPFVPRKLFWSFMVKAMNTTRREIYWLINISSLNVFTPKRLGEMKELNWYIESLEVVADKRWFGRYVFVKIGHTDKGFITCGNPKVF